MNYLSLGFATLGGTVASFAVGGLVMWLAPSLFEEARKYPAVFRPEDQMMAFMPVGLVGNVIAILIVAILFAMTRHGGSPVVEGARLGVLAGIFAVCVGVMHNYANFNIGSKLAAGQAAAYFVQWVVVGVVIGLIYKPVATP